MTEIDKIPGMVEAIERTTLIELARSIDVAESGPVIEFGTYFGLSTACIMSGLTEANTGNANFPLMHVYDSYRTRADSDFANYVYTHAEQSNSAALLEHIGDDVVFRKVFEKNLAPFISNGSLHVNQTDITEARCLVDQISMMHIDAPKFYREFRALMFEFFPRLKTGGKLVFQDYFFHWSGSVIAAVQHMVELRLIQPVRSAASALVAEVIAPITVDHMNQVDERMQSSFIPSVIDRAITTLQSIEIDRPRAFLPRLYLSKLPYFWELGRYKDAQLCVANAIALQNQSTQFTPAISDMIDMFGYGFRPELQYDKYHD